MKVKFVAMQTYLETIESKVCSNANIFRNNVYWRACESWEHQILATQIRTFEPKILYKNEHIEPERKFRRSYEKRVFRSSRTEVSYKKGFFKVF